MGKGSGLKTTEIELVRNQEPAIKMAQGAVVAVITHKATVGVNT
jgi:hypothetical protein